MEEGFMEADKEKWFALHPHQRPQFPPRTEMSLQYKADNPIYSTTFKLTDIVSKCDFCKIHHKGLCFDLVGDLRPKCCELAGFNIYASWECPCGAKGRSGWNAIKQHTRSKKHQSFVENE